MSQPIPESTILLIHGLSGSISGTVTTFLLYPLENIKTRLQVLQKQEEKKHDIEEGLPNESNNDANSKKKAVTLFEIIKQVFSDEGVQGFYKGVLPLCLGSFISYGVYFSCYEFFKKFFDRNFSLKQNNWKGYAITSCVAGCITTIATNPFWIINTKMAVDKSKKGFKATIKQLLNEEGPKGLLKGLKASLVLVSNPIIQFIIYEHLKKKNTNPAFFAFWSFIYGAISKAIATIVTFPYQVIRTNVQLEKDKRISEIISLIYEKKGVTGYFCGLTPKLTQSVINSALMLMIYERILLVVKKVLFNSKTIK